MLQEATINNLGNMDGDKLLFEPWIRVTRLAMLNKNQPEGIVWFPGRLSEKQQQDQETFGQKNGQACAKAHSVKLIKNGLKKIHNWTLREIS